MLNKKVKRVVAIIALVLMAVFTVSLPMYLAKPEMWDGRVKLIAVYTGVFGLLFFFVIWIDNKSIARQQKMDELETNEDAEAMKNDADSSVNKNQVEKSAESQTQSKQKNSAQIADEPKGKNDLSDKDLV